MEERIQYVTNGNAWIGVEGSEKTLEWIWDNHFAAVAADSIGFECWPPQEPWSKLYGSQCRLLKRDYLRYT